MAMRHLAFVVLLSAACLPARGEIYECIDQSGTKRFTNIAAEAKGCKALNVVTAAPAAPVQSTPAAKSQPKAPRVATPVSFPRVERQLQQRRDNDRRRILEQELGQEEKLLTEARKELSEQENARRERNHQRVVDRMDPVQKKVKLHEDNVANLRREISKIR